MARDPSFAPPISELAQSGIGVAVAPTGGMGLALDPSGFIPGAVVKLLLLTADPANPQDGQVWIRTDTNQFCARYSGATKRVTLA